MSDISNILMPELNKEAFPGQNIIRRSTLNSGNAMGRGLNWIKNNPIKTTAMGVGTAAGGAGLGTYVSNKAQQGAEAGVNNTAVGQFMNGAQNWGNKALGHASNFGTTARNWASAHPAAAGALGLGVPAALLAALMSEEHPYRNAILSGLLMGGVGAVGNNYLHSRGNQ